ncbi:GNAT family N-acetyltransferase [Streptomyces sp. TS71-3]|uniref:GNAT family N-acetyltransferase n=1 Tax=Streptomyces sp. TS71-3 TaxID=2733862 RepID=UPI001B2A7B55|nr:GNAT family N-acetyltransferase [Streptomyces sp. TS71-3]GHJ34422.1 UPF0256 protein [Streptomyces sp. TS71-3]
MRADPDIRTIAESDLVDWMRALNTGFLRPPTPTPAAVADRAGSIAYARARGAFDAGRCVATFRSFPQRLTAVGGASVQADAISSVTVSPTHRRRGLLSRMMAADLAEARERGDVVASLIAAEYPIYGRFGFGPAAGVADWEVDVPRAGLDPRWSGPADGGRIDLVDGAEVRKVGPELHERFLARQHGAVDRDEHWWQRATGQLGPAMDPTWTEPFQALYRAPDGTVEGLLAYRSDDVWNDAKLSMDTATVEDLIAVSPAAERALWHFLCSVDWITRVRTGHRAMDDLLPQFLPNPRAARPVTRADWLWVRILDTVRALESRTYAVPGSLVLEVVDRPIEPVEPGGTGAGTGSGGPAAGRYLLDATPDGASCTRTTRSPDVTLGAGELASLWLGEESATRLAALGRLTEHTPSATATAETLFRTARGPWCPDTF